MTGGCVPVSVRAALGEAYTTPSSVRPELVEGRPALQRSSMPFWAYILRCADGSFYTGHTDNLVARIGAHRTGAIPGHTKHRRPVTLAWSQDFPSRLEALEAERRIKGWSRAKKETLIAGDWMLLSELARNRQVEGRPSTSSGQTAGGGGVPLHTASGEPLDAGIAHGAHQ